MPRKTVETRPAEELIELAGRRRNRPFEDGYDIDDMAEKQDRFSKEVLESFNFNEDDSDIAPVNILGRDALKAIRKSTIEYEEARYLASTFLMIQQDRIRMQLRMQRLRQAGKPHLLVEFFHEQFNILEKNAGKALNAWAKGQPAYEWLISVRGIGPLLASMLLAMTPPDKCTSAGSLWRYAGIDVPPHSELATHAYSRQYKRLYWLIGQSFIKSASPDNFYYQMYLKRKQYEVERNERGELADQAAEVLKRYRYSPSTVAYRHYSQGKLPPQHIHARAIRWAVKLFLSHFAQVHYEMTFQKPQPTIYSVAILGHKDYIPPPGYTPLNPNVPVPGQMIGLNGEILNDFARANPAE